MGKLNSHYKVRYMTLPASEIWPGWLVPADHVQAENDRHQLYQKLEQSILSEGVQVPLVVRAGFYSQEYFEFMSWCCRAGAIKNFPQDPDKVLSLSKQRGNARLYVAKKLKVYLPCLVLDYKDIFQQIPELTTSAQVERFLAPHQPQGLTFADEDIVYQTGVWHEEYTRKSYD